MDFISQMNSVLDQLEASKEEPSVLITIGTGAKCFCSGFDLKYWALNPVNMLLSLVEFQKVLARFLELGIPSMAVFNGHAIAGGAFLGMVHDRIIMNSDKKFIIQLNELTFGKAPPYSYIRILKETTSPRVGRTLLMGTKLSPSEAERLDLVQALYSNDSELEKEI